MWFYFSTTRIYISITFLQAETTQMTSCRTYSLYQNDCHRTTWKTLSGTDADYFTSFSVVINDSVQQKINYNACDTATRDSGSEDVSFIGSALKCVIGRYYYFGDALNLLLFCHFSAFSLWLRPDDGITTIRRIGQTEFCFFGCSKTLIKRSEIGIRFENKYFTPYYRKREVQSEW